MLGCFSQLSVPSLGEMEQTVCMLERGTIITKYYPRRRPEQKTLMLRRETRQLIWASANANPRTNYDGAVELREIKEVRLGKNSKEFEKWGDESKAVDPLKCFIVFYGNEFKLRSLSVVALSEQECVNWMKGLRYMIADTASSPYPLEIERWLRKEFYSIENARETVTIKELKSFLGRVNCRMNTAKLLEHFNEIDVRKRGELRFDDFSHLFQKLLVTQNTIQECYSCFEGFPYSKDNETVQLQNFQSFLTKDQDDPLGKDDRVVATFLRDFVQDPLRDVQEPYLTIPEFIDYLFSKQNSIWDPRHDRVYMDMKKPLSHYWISSSHNTYLTGDQFSSESSTEAYVRALRMGCRCIELDCWDGPDNMPLIFHGHTFTTKIKFRDVIKTIKEHAFVTSEFPVILSIEQNCSLAQQRKMAQAMIEVFGDMLLTNRVDKNETQLPSPHQLRRKIILKHKKLPEVEDGTTSKNDESDNIRSMMKEGKLYLQDPVDKSWNLYLFVLTQHKIMYRSEPEESTRDEEFELCFPRPKESLMNDELHFGENWFHGKLEGGRQEAEQLLEAYKHLGDGTFLVRESATFVGDYSLSFWRKDKANHCRIKLKHQNGLTKYYLVEMHVFDSLYSLIMYYRQNMLRSAEFAILLKEPVPQPKKHETQDWFHPHTTREQADNVLMHLSDGSFLVRVSEQDVNAYAISFTAYRKIKNCRINVEGRLYIVGETQFESLVSLINYYTRNPLYRNVKLTYPISKEMLKTISKRYGNDAVTSDIENGEDDQNEASSYMDPSASQERCTVKAMYDYTAQNLDELSFCKHAIITNVKKKENNSWWTGDYGGKKQHYFPANYVVEIETSSDGCSDDSSGKVSTSHTDSFDVHGAVVSFAYESSEPEIQFKLRIQTPTMQNIFEIGFKNHELATEWEKAIKEAAQIASLLETQRRKKERNARVAKEMSDLIIYFRSVPFRDKDWVFYEMSSFPETKAEKYFIHQYNSSTVKYHQNQVSRVYPKGQRLDSSNFNPIPFWNVGSQMIALNYQTPDKPMQLNEAKFRDNGSCGYILKPKFMLNERFDPNDSNTLVDVDEKTINIRIIGARHLCKSRSNVSNPSVEVEVIGATFDSGIKHRTRSVENGFNPIWNELCEFHIKNPDFAMLRFEVQDEDMFGERNFIGQAVFPINCIRTGLRSISLKNKYSEDLELATLLVQIQIKNSESK
ncbi:1-phosphatidylinositol 4,5-bisphosphate phosphodiesterase gamma-1 [Pseudolycoriella hygida]|uniref:1-phosphatidylinositol 4,5-bisphosphate phosphodiesterase gamma n=1 Tax=Pseudolycoriella hygida TaxID=35572 RepID=A0A9Q0S7J5_9DIPT|nr:1-phosphatidylinositol 4,5-bisphosphate phosphodiesterase gamma-1 [Pseudolycoriella hygida]